MDDSLAHLYTSNCTVELSLFPDSDAPYVIANPALIPWSLAAAYIGITRFIRFRRVAYDARTSLYALCFLMYATMMTNAMFADSVLNNYHTMANALCSYVDLSMTSSIALMLLFCGLYDCDVIDPVRHFKSRVVMALGFASIWIGWLVTFINGAFTAGFLILYLGLISVCCPAYLVLEMHYMRKQKVSSTSIHKFLFTGFFGAIGFVGMLAANALCASFQNNVFLFALANGNAIWFLCSDLAMFYLGEYVSYSHTPAKYQALGIELN